MEIRKIAQTYCQNKLRIYGFNMLDLYHTMLQKTLWEGGRYEGHERCRAFSRGPSTE